MANVPSDLAVGRARTRGAAQLLQATIRSTATALDEPVLVSIDAQDPGRARGPISGWAPHGDLFPQAGDRAWVQLSDYRELVLVAWRPAA